MNTSFLGHNSGFTLMELLIAMTLTAVIGTVLFSTYAMVMDNGNIVRQRVLERESERVFWGILDNDMAGLSFADDDDATLPPLSREPIGLSDKYYRLTGEERPARYDGEILLSFATSSSLADIPGPVSGPVCVEYVLRNGSRARAFIRRERPFCGVDGDFPWTELVLVRNVRSLDIDLLMADGSYVAEWSAPLKTELRPEAVRFSLRLEEQPEAEVFLAPVFPRRSHVRKR